MTPSCGKQKLRGLYQLLPEPTIAARVTALTSDLRTVYDSY
jgi:hypothetical protein